MPKRVLPAIYFDEQLKPDVRKPFEEEGFRCLQIAKTAKYAGRDEADYINEIYAEEKLFATGDFTFIAYVREQNIKHGGIVGIPPPSSEDIPYDDIGILAQIIKVFIRNHGRNCLRKHIVYIGRDGYRMTKPQGEDILLYSWGAYHVDFETTDF
jgi:hypothetical protein